MSTMKVSDSTNVNMSLMEMSSSTDVDMPTVEVSNSTDVNMSVDVSSNTDVDTGVAQWLAWPWNPIIAGSILRSLLVAC